MSKLHEGWALRAQRMLQVALRGGKMMARGSCNAVGVAPSEFNV